MTLRRSLLLLVVKTLTGRLPVARQNHYHERRIYVNQSMECLEVGFFFKCQLLNILLSTRNLYTIKHLDGMRLAWVMKSVTIERKLVYLSAISFSLVHEQRRMPVGIVFLLFRQPLRLVLLFYLSEVFGRRYLAIGIANLTRFRSERSFVHSFK